MAPSPLQIVFNTFLTYIISLYANPQYLLKTVQDFMNFFIHFIKRIFLHYLKEDILKILKTESISKTALYNVNKCFESYRGAFDSLAKHNERNEILQQKGFLEAEKIQIGTVLEKKTD